MADYNSKYTGEQVEALLDIVSQGGVGGGGGGEGEVQKTTEAEITAMGFTKNLGTITEVKMNGVSKGTEGVVDLGNVVEKSEYDDTIDELWSDFETRQEKIEDLDDIRAGAALGATAMQSIDYDSLHDNLADSGFVHTVDGMIHRDDLDDTIVDSLNAADTAYQKPSTGIAKTDLAEDVQNVLSSAFTEAYVKTNTPKYLWVSNESSSGDIVVDIDAEVKDVASAVSDETDGLASAKNVKTYVDNSVNNKVDKVSGKGLSTEDFTSALKTKLEGLSNYNDTEISNAVASLQTQLNTLVSGNADNAINSFNEIIAFLDGIKDTQDLASIIASIEQQIAAVARVIPTKVSELDNDEGYLTEHQDVSGKLDKTEAVSTYLTKADAQTTYLGINDKAKSAEFADKATQATRATQDASGRNLTVTYATKAELGNKQDKISDLATIRSGAALGATALQSEQYKGTVTKVKINGSEKTPDANGLVDLGTIEGGSSGGGSSVQEGMPIEHVTVIAGSTTLTLQPNTFYDIECNSLSSVFLSIEFAPASNDNIVNEYAFRVTPSEDCSMDMPESIRWASGSAPNFFYGFSYEVSIINNTAVFASYESI